MQLNEDYVRQLTKFVDDAVDSGRYDKEAAKYQVHVLHEPLFYPLLESLLVEAHAYCSEPVLTHSWVYVDFKSAYDLSERRAMWHTHRNCITAILYLKNTEKIGTEFMDGSFMLPLEHSWLFMDGFEYHRPPIPRTEERRYTVAANIIELKEARSIPNSRELVVQKRTTGAL